MSLLGMQFEQRHNSDQASLQHAMESIYIGITGDEEARTFSSIENAQGAIAKILAYYGEKPDAPLKKECSIEALLRHHLASTGISYRQVRLTDKWYKDAMGPYLSQREDGVLIALLPGKGGYYYNNPDTGTVESVKAESTGRDFMDVAYCFYRPLPNKELGIKDLIVFVLKSLDVRDYMAMITASLGMALLGCLLPVLNKFAFGPVVEAGDSSIVLSVAIMLLSVTLIQVLIAGVQGLVMQRITIKLSNSINTAIMMRMMNLPPSFFKKFSSGSLATRYNSATQVSTQLVQIIFGTALTCLFSLLYVAQMLTYAPGMAFPAMAVLLVTAAANAIIAYLTTIRTKSIIEKDTERAGLETAMIDGIQKIRLAGAETRFFSVWAERFAQTAMLSYGKPGILVASTPVTLFMTTLGFAVISMAAINGGVYGDAATYIAFSAAYGLAGAAFANVNLMMTQMFSIKPHLEMLEPILKAIPETISTKTRVTKIRGAISLEGVTFGYDPEDKPLFEDLNIAIAAGEYVGIVGKTGCGKSTIMRLIMGFETPSKGSILFDDIDAAILDVRSLRQCMGVVLQNGTLISGSIFDNIAIATPDLTLDEAWEAAGLVGLAEDIRSMPMGMNTRVSARGGGLSGGQRQRVMIARAIAGKPKILLFDEATSALDNITQQQVADSLARLKCTRVVIAHRLSTIKDCDRILVLDEGKIVESGSYDELMELGGVFADLVERQIA